MLAFLQEELMGGRRGGSVGAGGSLDFDEEWGRRRPGRGRCGRVDNQSNAVSMLALQCARVLEFQHCFLCRCRVWEDSKLNVSIRMYRRGPAQIRACELCNLCTTDQSEGLQTHVPARLVRGA